jgi:F0F1-type ATP synthase gamma subunit
MNYEPNEEKIAEKLIEKSKEELIEDFFLQAKHSLEYQQAMFQALFGKWPGDK